MRTSNRARWTALVAAALAVVLVGPAGAQGAAGAGTGAAAAAWVAAGVQVGGGTRPVIVRGTAGSCATH